MRVHRNCCGLGVHKKIIAACLIEEDAEANSIDEKRQFGSMTRDLLELARWLCAAEVPAEAMEATGFSGLESTGTIRAAVATHQPRALQSGEKRSDWCNGFYGCEAIAPAANRSDKSFAALACRKNGLRPKTSS